MTTPRTRWAVTAGSAGLVAGLALGVTGFASAADPSPTPSVGVRADGPQQGMRGGPMRDRMDKRLEHRGGGGGLVSAIDGDSISLRTPGGAKTIALNGSTTYYTGQTKATKSAIKVGSVVRVRLVDPKATNPVAAVVSVMPAHVGGWVTKVDGSTITLTDHSGFTRTIHTSSSTTYVKDGATATKSAITVGTFVRAQGQVDGDGTTLNATRIATGQPDKGDRVKGDKLMMEGPAA